MPRRRWFIPMTLVLCATAARAAAPADPAAAAEETVSKAASALRDRKAAAFWLLFDRTMPGYQRLRQDSDALLEVGHVESTIRMEKNEGDDRARNLQLDWQMEIVQEEDVPGTTRRAATVKCRLELREGDWRIVSFDPIGLFAPIHAAEAWRALTDAASALMRRSDYVPRDPTWFLSLFDPRMPGYQDLVNGITALLRLGDVNSSISLVSSDGDDQHRTLVVDWELDVVDAGTKTQVLDRRQNVTLRMEWQGKHWRVVAAEPLAFFEM